MTLPVSTEPPRPAVAELPVRVYTPERALKHPGVLVRELAADIGAGRELAWRLFVRDLSAQYRQTILGYVWAFLPPLVSAATFIFLQSQGITRIEGTGIPYPAYAMMGTLLWQVFVDAMQSPIRSVKAGKSMLAKINFPREALLMGGLYMVLFNFAIRLALLAGVMVIWDVVPDAGLLLFPAALFGLLACGYAVGMTLLPIGTLYGDVSRGISIIAGFWMLLTPVVYPPQTAGLAGLLTTWNPVSPVLITARESLGGGAFSMLPEAALITGLSTLVVLMGLIAFRLVLPMVIERMGS